MIPLIFLLAAEYWVCAPMKDNPRFMVARGEEPGSAFILTDRDFIHDGEAVPAGTYRGTLKNTPSGFSAIATLPLPLSKSPRLSIALSLKSPVFAAEAYVLYGETDGFILDNYTCRHRKPPQATH